MPEKQHHCYIWWNLRSTHLQKRCSCSNAKGFSFYIFLECHNPSFDDPFFDSVTRRARSWLLDLVNGLVPGDGGSDTAIFPTPFDRYLRLSRTAHLTLIHALLLPFNTPLPGYNYFNYLRWKHFAIITFLHL